MCTCNITWLHVCTCVCTCVRTCIHTYIHTCTHTYTRVHMCSVHVCTHFAPSLYSWCVLRSQEVDPSYTRDPPPSPKANQHCSLPTPGANTLLTNERGATMATAGVTVWCDDADDWGESRYGGPQSYSLLRVEHVTSTAHVAVTTQRVR